MRTRIRDQIHSRWETLLLSFLVPGLGHLAAGKVIRGTCWFLVFPAAWVAAIGCVLNPAYSTLRPLALLVVVGLALWLVMLVTAYFAARKPKDRTRNQPGLAGLLSALLPGLGQLLNGHRLIGALMLALVFLGTAMTALMAVQPDPEINALAPWVGGSVYSLVSVWSIVGAVQAGQRAVWGKTFLAWLFLGSAVASNVMWKVSWLVTTSCLQPFEVRNKGMTPTFSAPRYKALDTGDLGLGHYLRTGESRVLLRARLAGTVEDQGPTRLDGYQLVIDSVTHRVPLGLTQQVEPGDNVVQGQIIASGLHRSGDHVVVNRLAYRAQPPQRGDLVLFSAAGIDHPNIDREDQLVLRVVGLPGERIHVDPPYVHVNGMKLARPAIFDDISRGRQDYIGYKAAHPLAHPPPLMAKDTDAVTLGEDEYLLLGDNGIDALDGRYFGPVKKRHILGKVVRLYWPLNRACVPR